MKFITSINSSLAKVFVSKENSRAAPLNNTNKLTLKWKKSHIKNYEKETKTRRIKKTIRTKPNFKSMANVGEFEEKYGSRWRYTVNGILNKQK